MNRAAPSVAELRRQARHVRAAGRPGVAWLLLAAARQLDPDDASIAREAAQSLIDLDRANEAITLLNTAIAHDAHATSFTCRAAAFIKLGNFQAAIDDCIEALARQPCHGPSAGMLATLLMQRGDIARSVDVLQRAIAAGANDAVLHSALAAGLRALASAVDANVGSSEP